MDDGSLGGLAVASILLAILEVRRLCGWAREATAGTLLDRSEHELQQVRRWLRGSPSRLAPRWLRPALAVYVVALVGWLLLQRHWIDLAFLVVLAMVGVAPHRARRTYGPVVLEALGDHGLPVDETPLQREASERRRRWTRRWLLAAGLAAAVSVAAGVGAGSVDAGWPVWVAAVAGVLAVVAVGGAGWANTWVYGDERPVEG